MIQDMVQARQSVASLNPDIDFGIIMCYPPANYAQYLWQAAYREATQGESDPCQYGHDDSYYASGCCDVCGDWAADVPEYEADDAIDADYLDSLERDSIEGAHFYA